MMYLESKRLPVLLALTLGLRTLVGIAEDEDMVRAAAYTVQQWQAVEIPLTSTQTYADPFEDVDVMATFTGPGGTVITRPAFWDGGSSWKVRFAPTKTGDWTMTTVATDTTNVGLHNVTTTVQSEAYTGSLDIYVHGFLKVSPDGRYLTYADGTPFFYLGDTHWILPHERFATSNAKGVASQFKYVVDKRISQGFTVFQSEPIWNGGLHRGADEEAVANFGDGFSSDDLAGLANLDRKFKYIADQGLVHAHAQVTGAPDPATEPVYTDAYMTRLTTHWVARYGAYPVIWTIAQEIDANMYDKFTRTTMSKWFATGQSILENDAYAQPIMPHMQNTRSVSPSSSWWASKPYHHGWAVQWAGEMTEVETAKSYWNSTPPKPAVVYESSYDNFWTDNRGALGAAYKAFQSGMYGYGYGAAGVWNDIYSKSGDREDFGTAYEIPERYYWWYDGANLKTGNQLAHFKAFYTRLQWWTLTPRFDDPKWSSFAEASRSLLSTSEQDTYVTFFFGSGRSTGTLKNMMEGSTYRARWFDPRTGAYRTIRPFSPSGGEWTMPSRPSDEDWVLLVERTPTTSD